MRRRGVGVGTRCRRGDRVDAVRGHAVIDTATPTPPAEDERGPAPIASGRVAGRARRRAQPRRRRRVRASADPCRQARLGRGQGRSRDRGRSCSGSPQHRRRAGLPAHIAGAPLAAARPPSRRAGRSLGQPSSRCSRRAAHARSTLTISRSPTPADDPRVARASASSSSAAIFGEHLEPVAHLAVDLHDRGHRLLDEQRRVGLAPAGSRDRAGRSRAAPTCPPPCTARTGRQHHRDGLGRPRARRGRRAPGPESMALRVRVDELHQARDDDVELERLDRARAPRRGSGGSAGAAPRRRPPTRPRAAR